MSNSVKNTGDTKPAEIVADFTQSLPDLLASTLDQKLTRKELIDILVEDKRALLEQEVVEMEKEIRAGKAEENRVWESAVRAAREKLVLTATPEEQEKLDKLVTAIKEFHCDNPSMEVVVEPSQEWTSCIRDNKIELQIFVYDSEGKSSSRNVCAGRRGFNTGIYVDCKDLLKLYSDNIPWAHPNNVISGNQFGVYGEGKVSELIKEYLQLDKELKEFNLGTQKFRVQATKQLLGLSENGQRILRVLASATQGRKRNLASELTDGE